MTNNLYYFPLSEEQKQLVLFWEKNQLTTSLSTHDIVVLKGGDAEVLRHAATSAVEAHCYLKTRLLRRNGELMQIRRDEEPVVILSNTLEEKPDKTFFESRVRPFDIFHEPLYRLEIYQFGTETYLFADIHRSICDDFSLHLLISDIKKVYHGESLEHETYTAFDFALDELRLTKSEKYLEATGYFMKLLKGNQSTTYPHSRENDAENSGQVAHTVEGQHIVRFCHEQGLQPDNYFLTLAMYVLHNFTREDNIVITATDNGRNNPELSHTMGMFTKTLPVVSAFDHLSITVAEAMKAVQQQFEETKAYSFFPFSKHEELYGLHADITFSYASTRTVLHGPLTISIAPYDDDFIISLEYDKTLYSRQDIMVLVSSLANTAINAPKTKLLNDVPLISQEEKLLLHRLGTGKKTDYDHHDTLVSLFRKQAAQTPGNTAVVFMDRTLTYQEVDEQTDRLAAYLTDRYHILPEEPVGIMIERSELMLLYPMAVMKAGATYMPLDPHFPTDRLEYMCHDAGVRIILSEDNRVTEKMPHFDGNVFYSDVLDRLPQATAQNAARPEGRYTILYTSGSTGKPKGVALEHRNMVNFCHWYTSEFRITPADHILAYANFGFDAHMMDLYPALSCGACIYIVPDELRMDVVALNEYMEHNHINVAFLTTQIGNLFASTIQNHSLRLLAVGGEKLMPVAKPRYDFYNIYGPTECTIASTFYNIRQHYDSSLIGIPLSNSQLFIVNDHLQLLPHGIPGELLVCGDGVARGYLHAAEKDLHKFTTFNGMPCYRTGDLCRWSDDGNLEFLGRIDGQVKLRGLRIELGEIEACASKFQGIRQVAVAVKSIGSNEHLCLYYTTEDSHDHIDTSALKDFMAASLTDFMLPTSYTQLTEMPVTSNGKIDRKLLPVPKFTEHDIIAPETPLEKQLFNILSEQLDCYEFGVTTNLVSMGLSSLAAMRLSMAIHDRLGVAIGMVDIMKDPTIRGIAKVIEVLQQTRDTQETLASYPRQEYYPLTENQRGLYLDWELNRDTTQYNIAGVYRFTDTDAHRLAEAMRQTVEAHSYLKTRLVINANGEVMQQRHDDEPAEIAFYHTDHELTTDFFQQKVRPFHLLQDRLYRIEIFETPQHTCLFMDIHHIIFDGISMALLMEDAMKVYQGEALQPEHYQAFDFALHEQQLTGSESMKQAEAYFDELLAPATLAVYPRSAKGTTSGKQQQQVILDRKHIESWCRQHSFTESNFFLTVLLQVLHRILREEQLCITTIDNGRSEVDLLHSVGMFVKTLPVTSCRQLTQQVDTMTAAVQRMQEQFLVTKTYSFYPFTKIVERHAVRPEIMFVYQGDLYDASHHDNVHAESLALDTAKLPLLVMVSLADKDHYTLVLQYNGSLYNHQDMERLASMLVTFALRSIAAPLMNTVSLLSDQAQAEILQLSQGKLLPVDLTKTFACLFTEQARRTPDACAVADKDGQLSYSDLDHYSNLMAHRLIALGVKPNHFVSILLDRRKEFPLSVLAIHKTGAAYMPLDMEYPNHRLLYMLQNSEASVLVTTHAVMEAKKAEADFHIGNVTLFYLDDFMNSAETQQAAQNSIQPIDLSTPEGLAYMIYTSGSTGKPKGAILHQAGLSNFIAAITDMEHLTADDRISGHHSFSVNEHVEDMFPILTLGGSLHIMPTEIRKNPEDIRNFIIKHQITGGGYPTDICRLLLNNCHDLPLRFIAAGGEKLHGVYSDHMEIFNFYGPTECAGVTSYHSIAPGEEDKDIPIGKTIANCWNFIIDDAGLLLPPGIAGELCFAGIQVGRGYWRLPEETALAFVDCPFVSEDQWGHRVRMFHTGELCRWNEDGELEHICRIDNLVKLRGMHIETGEIEKRAMLFDGIRQAAVAVKNVNNIEQLCLYYNTRKPVDEMLLKKHLRGCLPEYMLPDIYILLDVMPMNINGDIERKALPRPIIMTEKGMAPCNDTEKRLLDIAQQLLGNYQLGVNSNLMAMGITSLWAMKFAFIVHQKLNLHLDTKQILLHPTVKELAALSEKQMEQYDYSNKKQEFYPITENQRGIYIDWERNRNTTMYNIPCLMRFTSRDDQRLAEAIRKAIDAHSYLKARLKMIGGEVMQQRNDEEAAVVGLCRLDDEPDRDFFQQKVRPFNLLEDRLYRIEVIQAAEHVYVFMDIHHIIFDGISMSVFMRDVLKAYHGERLEPEEYQAFDFALDEQLVMQGDRMKVAERRFDELIREANLLRIPHSTTANGIRDGKINVSIPGKLIDAFCAAHGVTAGSYMQAAFAEAMYRISREERLLYLTINNGRGERLELQACVGMFVKTLPVVRPATRRDTLSSDFVKSMQEQLLDSYAQDFYPYTRIVERHGIHAEVLFVYQGGFSEGDDMEGIETIPLRLNRTKMPLTVIVYPNKGEYCLSFEYDGTRYVKHDMERLAHVYGNIARSMATTKQLRDACNITGKEKDALIALSTGQNLNYNASETWVDMFQRHVAGHPDNTAVVDDKGQLSYLELDRQSDAIAAWLVSQGVCPGDFVAIKMGRIKEFHVAVLGIHKAGAAYVPIDPDYPEERIEYMLNDCDAKVILTEQTVTGHEYEGDFTSLATPNGRAYMIYTSGSTGKPKGVVIQHKALRAFAEWMKKELHLNTESRNAQHSSFSFDASIVDLLCPLAAGGACYIIPEEIRRDTGAIYEYLRNYHITGLTLTTQFGMTLLSMYRDFSLEYLLMGGEKLLQIPKTNIKIINGYGPTEFTICSSFHVVNQDKETEIPIGRAVPNSYSFICDVHGHLLPQGLVGELCLAGAQIAQGYWKQNSLTNEKFTDCSFLPGQKMYHTGDLARYNEEGELEYLGRIDTQVKFRGFRIELGEIENRASQMNGIRQVAAEVRNGQTLCLYYTAQEDIDKDKLKSFLAETLTEYMVPSVYMQLSEMPMTPNGKIDRKRLPDPDVTSAVPYEQPEEGLEATFATIFAEVLHVERVGANDNFFDIGGTSINAIRVIVEANKQGIQIVFNDLFNLKTPRELAAFVKKGTKVVSRSNFILQAEAQKEVTTPSTSYSSILKQNTLNAFRQGEKQPLGDILLTGATGYLGINILRHLINHYDGKIYCPIRCPKEKDAMKRLKTLYFYYFDDEKFDIIDQRVEVFAAEITQADALDHLNLKNLTVINCVANVKHFSSGNDIEQVNIESVRNLIRFCERTHSRLVHISTTSIAGNSIDGTPDPERQLTEQDFHIGQYVNDNQYVHSKFVAEDLVLDAVFKKRIQAKIMRVGNLSARQSDGKFQINYNSNNAMGLLKAQVILGVIPYEVLDSSFEFSPVDETAQAILLLAETPDECIVFHPFNNHSILFSDIIKGFEVNGVYLKKVEQQEFQQVLSNALMNPEMVLQLRPLLAYYNNMERSVKPILTSNTYTTQVLHRLGFDWQMTDKDYVARFVKELAGLGYFDV